MSFRVGQHVTYRGGRVVYRVTATEGHMVTLLRADGKDDGNPTKTSSSNLAGR
ncbi:hypothetical protein [Mycobacteroides abscessus]|uniref:hypothetical protein n=1 Tax=Mycobacteroides abscessus TaxID=36809 RepID=UPI0009C5FDEE|nr:hypothetical protein [Mycobacteroides abscessus]SLJ76335.1 Uncharacterised protein [Mycobacteroides abscessus subsp. abscessus]SLJ80698.1 Uncharacterised protein [Mycobacteroides abscessus subsp. abscessus]